MAEREVPTEETSLLPGTVPPTDANGNCLGRCWNDTRDSLRSCGTAICNGVQVAKDFLVDLARRIRDCFLVIWAFILSLLGFLATITILSSLGIMVHCRFETPEQPWHNWILTAAILGVAGFLLSYCATSRKFKEVKEDLEDKIEEEVKGVKKDLEGVKKDIKEGNSLIMEQLFALKFQGDVDKVAEGMAAFNKGKTDKSKKTNGDVHD